MSARGGEKLVGMEALSERQRRLVRRHLPLVLLTLERMPGVSRRRTGRERGELLQEGSLALAEAVRHHDPSRHGAFGPYAMSRVRFAISRYAHEHHSSIRVPFITQRRSRQRREADRHDPNAPPRFVTCNLTKLRDDRSSPHAPDGAARGATIGELLRQRYDAALAAAERQLGRRTGRAGRAALVERCVRERWMVPEPEEKTALRALAAEQGCPLSRVARCDAEIRAAVAAALRSDAAFAYLCRLRERREGGLAYRLSGAELQEMAEFGRARLPPSRDTPAGTRRRNGHDLQDLQDDE